MFCPKCGKENSNYAKFCQECGLKIEGFYKIVEQSAADDYKPDNEKATSQTLQNNEKSSHITIKREKNIKRNDDENLTITKHLVDYAGFWNRVSASIIDSILIFIGSFIIDFVIANSIVASWGKVEEVIWLFFLIFIVLNWFYYALMESSTSQATLGKMFLGIIVTDLEGERVSFKKASGRYWGKIFSILTGFIGFLMVGFTQKKQALHDILAGCLVVDKYPKSNEIEYNNSQLSGNDVLQIDSIVTATKEINVYQTPNNYEWVTLILIPGSKFKVLNQSILKKKKWYYVGVFDKKRKYLYHRGYISATDLKDV